MTTIIFKIILDQIPSKVKEDDMFFYNNSKVSQIPLSTPVFYALSAIHHRIYLKSKALCYFIPKPIPTPATKPYLCTRFSWCKDR